MVTMRNLSGYSPTAHFAMLSTPCASYSLSLSGRGWGCITSGDVVNSYDAARHAAAGYFLVATRK